MNYSDFNTRALVFYTQRATTKFCSFSLDQTEFASLIGSQHPSNFELLKDDWTVLTKGNSAIPQYFGLIALQCFAATQMEEANNVTERAYIYRLQALMGQNVDFQRLFKMPVGEDIVQEKIWYDAKQFLSERFGMELEIPARKQGNGRYVQYPLSQLLLKTEDLKDFTVFFAEHFIAGENIPFVFFYDSLKEWIPRTISERAEQLLSDPLKRERCYEQLFNFFQSWSGEVVQRRCLPSQKAPKLPKVINYEASRLVLLMTESQPAFYSKRALVPSHKLFTLSDRHYFYNGIMLFNPIPDYEEEYEYSRFLCLHTTAYLLVDRRLKPREYHYLELHSLAKFPIALNQTLFRYHISAFIKSHPLAAYCYSINPVSLIGGIKLSRGNLFLAGFGPQINYCEKFTVLFESRPVNYDPHTALPGDYKVRTANYRDHCFSLVSTDAYTDEASLSLGWDFSKMTISDNPKLEGCRLYPLQEPTQHPVRAWINANLGRKVTASDMAQNFTLATLTYAYKKTAQR